MSSKRNAPTRKKMYTRKTTATDHTTRKAELYSFVKHLAWPLTDGYKSMLDPSGYFPDV